MMSQFYLILMTSNVKEYKVIAISTGSNLTMKAFWKGQKIAESDETVVVERNHYFPPGSVDMSFLMPSKTKTKCYWKGVAKYYTIKVGEDLNVDACWYYPKPEKEAENIKDHVAFWRGVEITD